MVTPMPKLPVPEQGQEARELGLLPDDGGPGTHEHDGWMKHSHPDGDTKHSHQRDTDHQPPDVTEEG